MLTDCLFNNVVLEELYQMVSHCSGFKILNIFSIKS